MIALNLSNESAKSTSNLVLTLNPARVNGCFLSIVVVACFMLEKLHPVFGSGRQNIPALSSKILPLSFTQADEVRNGYTNVTSRVEPFVDLSTTSNSRYPHYLGYLP